MNLCHHMRPFCETLTLKDKIFLYKNLTLKDKIFLYKNLTLKDKIFLYKNSKIRKKVTKKIMSQNEPGSRISFNLRSPDHLRWIPGPEKINFFRKKSDFFRTEIVFFGVFHAQEHSRNDPDQFWEKRFSPIFVDFRRNFRGVARFSPKIVIIHGNS